MLRPLLYLLVSLLLLATPWLGGTGATLLIGFVPLLALQRYLFDKRAQLTASVSSQTATKATKHNKGKASPKKRPRIPFHLRLWPYLTLLFALWWGATTWWVGYASVLGAVLSVLFGSALCTTAFMCYHAVWSRAPKPLAYTVLVSAWIAYELLYLEGEISFPWLTLGNGFANDIWLIQWYEHTGVLGGSLWVLLANLFLFEAWEQRRNLRRWGMAALVIGVPIGWSLIRFNHYAAPQRSVTATVIQPNFDPYEEKFVMGEDEQTAVLLSLMEQAPRNVGFMVLPETAIGTITTLWEERLPLYNTVQEFRALLQAESPATTLITGAPTAHQYRDSAHASATARNSGDLWYDYYNSALSIDTSQRICIHHKSLLVAGVEKMPYYSVLRHLDFLTTDLGGITGQLGTDPYRKVFTTPQGICYGTAICYESVYGSYFAQFVRNGAQVMFVITNDGWWDDTPGYRQHFSYARLRAIETRRAIARSANTGISGFINSRGEVADTLGWNQRGTVNGTLSVNNEITFYTRYGDLIGRIATYLFVLSLLYFMAYRIRRRNHLNA